MSLSRSSGGPDQRHTYYVVVRLKITSEPDRAGSVIRGRHDDCQFDNRAPL